jgi:flavorubredoxin
MKPVELKKGIYWVGAIDWDLRNFHGYLTPRGSTYNAYLIVDEKIVLVDAVKQTLADELLSRVRGIIDPAKIDYLVVNHVEPDHSGSVPRIMEAAPGAKIVITGSRETNVRPMKSWSPQMNSAATSRTGLTPPWPVSLHPLRQAPVCQPAANLTFQRTLIKLMPTV